MPERKRNLKNVINNTHNLAMGKIREIGTGNIASQVLLFTLKIMLYPEY